MGPPGGSRNDITRRMTRHLNVISIDNFSHDTTTKIFGTIVDWQFENYESAIKRAGKMMVQATLGVYDKTISSFLPTPTKSHYVFNLRDFARVIRGILLVSSDALGTSLEKFIRLWVHEVYRVFYDRLIDDADRELFFSIVKDCSQTYFKLSLEKVSPHLYSGRQLLVGFNFPSLFACSQIYLTIKVSSAVQLE